MTSTVSKPEASAAPGLAHDRGEQVSRGAAGVGEVGNLVAETGHAVTLGPGTQRRVLGHQLVQSMASRMLLLMVAFTATAMPDVPPSKSLAIVLLPLGEPVVRGGACRGGRACTGDPARTGGAARRRR